MKTVRFLQVSDLHLGGRAWPSCFALDHAKAAIRKAELRQSVRRLLELVRGTTPDLVLIPGDFFDRESVDAATVNLVVETFAAMGDTPVFLAPGNHDYMSPTSPYAQDERKRRGLTPWPPNVHLFSGHDWNTLYLPDNADVSITARAFRANVPVTERPLSGRIPRDPAALSILMLHGARTQFAFEESQKITCPFTSAELLAQGFTYTALGHYHTFSEIRDGNGNLRAVYGGRPFAAEFTRSGAVAGGCVVGTLTAEGAVDCSCHPLDGRRLLDVEVPCEGVGTPEILAAMAREAFDAAGGTDQDLVRFRFVGTHVPDWTPRVPPLAGIGFAACGSVAGLRAGYDLAALVAEAEREAAGVESLFAREMTARLEAEGDPDARVILEDALDYGLRALRGLPLEVRDVD